MLKKHYKYLEIEMGEIYNEDFDSYIYMKIKNTA